MKLRATNRIPNTNPQSTFRISTHVMHGDGDMYSEHHKDWSLNQLDTKEGMGDMLGFLYVLHTLNAHKGYQPGVDIQSLIDGGPDFLKQNHFLLEDVEELVPLDKTDLSYNKRTNLEEVTVSYYNSTGIEFEVEVDYDNPSKIEIDVPI